MYLSRIFLNYLFIRSSSLYDIPLKLGGFEKIRSSILDDIRYYNTGTVRYL